MLTARLSQANGGEDRWQVGLMLRESLDPGARHSAVVLQKTSTRTRFRSIRRELEERPSQGIPGNEAAPPDAWVRIERRGSELVSSSSADGETWAELNRVAFDPPLPEMLLGGVVAIGHDSRPDSNFEPLGARVCNLEVSTGTEPGVGPFLRGDCNADSEVNISDAICALDRLFAGGASPGCLAALNTNGDDKVDIADPVSLLTFLFSGGPPPVGPYPDCGPGSLPADEELGCETPPEGCPR